MKRRLLLSALSCVLALGLVSACNDEEEDLSGGDMGTETDGGGSGSDTSGGGSGDTTDPGTKEAVTLTNYTLAFTFIDEDEEPTTLGEDVDLYISGDWNSWSFDICTLGEDGVYTLTIASIDAGTYEYKGVTVATGETPASDWSNVEEVITGTSGTTGNAELVVAASEGDNYTHAITVSITGGVVAEPFDPSKYTFVYTITLTNSSTPLEAAPATIELYAAGDFNGTKSTEGDWYVWGEEVKLYNNEDGTYYLGLDFIPESGRSFEILSLDTTDSIDDMYGHVLGTYSITSTYTDTGKYPITETISIETEYTGWIGEGCVYPEIGEDVDFYILLIDNSTTTGLTEATTAYFQAQRPIWSGEDYCTGTYATTGDSAPCFYSEKATAGENTTFWSDLNVNSAYMSIPSASVPSSEQGTPVLVAEGWMSSDWVSGTETWNATLIGWDYISSGSDIASFVSSYSSSSSN